MFLNGVNLTQWKNLKYGSMPATVMAIFVPALKLSVSFFKLKPVSHYVSLRFSSENSEQYGQQQRVISDIKFLKEEIGRKPSTIFSVFAGETFTFWRSFLDDKIKGSPVPKFGSAPQDKLRIIAFLNDLDHYEDSVLVRVLQVLNTVLKVCKINFIVALDKNIIRKAFQTSSENKDDVDHPIAKYEAIPTENNVWACNGQVNTRGDIEKGIQLTSTEKSKEPQEMANSKEEIVTFRRLNCFASEIPNLRHSYTKYHNFARNVISKTMGNHRENSHQWKVELVAWIFICSQWRHEMNILIKDWHTYIDFKEDEKMKQEPSLKDIVANYIKK
ncbi:uncharacterized protein LOC131044135 [Cryptomeria japonica]|uniref:uncharacterized protein LOC131044135 n=1 Tax=Cryptomeria japonica TaxID=3369 RepID=UPI0025AC81E8|nr:uncharacterized protein LOC131044135 [Cryptomeria japonica]XP_057833377.1 uncharacterized protein LOC131044135 [Cryptomeria japonica]XP_059069953.1 uncharacterized protein LOC131044135 [Cryptomeria japonica]XP_059069954.1 uncharacterized protein LOC131044135 [Cryptomeria japonica]